jgi:hypothetical protein
MKAADKWLVVPPAMAAAWTRGNGGQG